MELPPGNTPPPDSENPAPPPPSAAEILERGAPPEDSAAELLALRERMGQEESRRKGLEIRLSELEDENRRLKTPPPTAPEKNAWLRGSTFFD